MSLLSKRQPIARATDQEALRRHRPDFLIVLFMGMLLLLGLVVLFAISPARVELLNNEGNTLDQNHFMYKQLMYLLVGLVGFGIAAVVPFQFWKKHQTKILVGGLGLCVLLAILGMANTPLALCANGACRWYNLGFGSFQPAELVKFGLVIFLASFLAARIQQGRLNDLHATLIPVGVVLGMVALLIVGLQKDMGTGITIFGIVGTMLFAAGIKSKYIVGSLIVSLVAGILFIVTSPHRMERVVTFFAPSHSDANSYHIDQALIAVGSGGLTGKGLGQGIQAFGYLPEAVNDSIFAILGEKFGFVGLVAILAIFAALFVRLLKIMDNTPNQYYKLIVAGVFGWLVTHTIVNIGAMLGIFPLTGITLPFLSYGGTSLLFVMLALGLVFHVSRYTNHQAGQITRGEYENTRSGRGVGRSRDPGPRRFKRA